MEYLIQINAVLLVLYGLYIALFRNLTFFRWNRIFLLVTPLLALCLPLIKFTAFQEAAYQLQLPMIAVGNAGIESDVLSEGFSLLSLAQIIYWTGLLISFGFFMFRFSSLLHWFSGVNFKYQQGYWIGSGHDDTASFSFFNFIFINQKDGLNAEYVLMHEQWHFKFGHSIDNLFYELLKCVCWINPLVYFMHKELRNLHEYEVDFMLKSQGEEKEFLEAITEEIPVLRELRLTNPYKSKSNLLNRITMFYRKPSSMIHLTKYAMIMPSILLAFFLVACADSHEQINSDELTTDMEQSEVFPPERLQELSQQPQFSGGMDALMEYLSTEIHYPEEAKKDSISGKVLVSFVIAKSGKVENVKVLNGIHPLLDKEAVRAVSAMPDWTPGMYNDQKVSVEYFLPIMFALN